jgi:hypothetical protein
VPSGYCLDRRPGVRIAAFVRCTEPGGACAENRLRSTRPRIPLRQRLRGQGRHRARVRRGGHRRSLRGHGVRGPRLLVRGPAGALAPPRRLPRPGRALRRHPPGRLHPQAAVRQLRHLECPPLPDLDPGRGPPDLVLARGGPADRRGAAPGAAQHRRRPPGGAGPGRGAAPGPGGPQPPGRRLRLRRRGRRAGRPPDAAVRLRQPPPRHRGHPRGGPGPRALGDQRRRRPLARAVRAGLRPRAAALHRPRGGQGHLGELLDADPRGQLRGPVHRPQLRRVPGPPVRAAPGRARPGRREPGPLPGRRRRPDPAGAGRGAGRVQGQRRLRHGRRQLRRGRRVPVGAGLLARHPPRASRGRWTRSASP